MFPIYRKGRNMYFPDEEGNYRLKHFKTINEAKAESRPYHNTARLCGKQSIVKVGKPS